VTLLAELENLGFVHLFDGDFLACFFICAKYDLTVGTLTKDLAKGVV